MKDKLYLPYVVVSPSGLYYAGMHTDEDDCWQVALGWPDDAEIQHYKDAGWYCTDATLRWKNPRKQSTSTKAENLCYN